MGLQAHRSREGPPRPGRGPDPQEPASSTVLTWSAHRSVLSATVTSMDTDDLAFPRLRLRRDAVARGWSDDELAALTRAGSLTRLRRGAYVDGRLPETAVARHRLLVHATLAALRRPAAVSHQSAAVLLGLPLWGVPLREVHITRPSPAASESSRTLRCHVGALDAEDCAEVDGVQVTSPARTVLDLARTVGFASAVVTADAALRPRGPSREGLTSGPALIQQLDRVRGAPGSRRAERVVSFADGRSESVGESRSRVVLDDLGLAPTALQYEIPSGNRVLARTDFAWEDVRLIGEFDGRVKYGRLLRPGQQPGDAVFEEKLREDAIRDAGYGVVRWCWNDLAQPMALGIRVSRARERARRQPSA